jgi:hypothetical protein
MFRVYVNVAAEEIALGDKWMDADQAIATAEEALKKGLSIEIRNGQGEVIFLTALKGTKNANGT